MPSRIESIDYDLFDYKNSDTPPLGLSEAVSKAESLRKTKPENFYRVLPLNKEMDAFRVEEVSREEAYAALKGRIVQRWLSYLRRHSA